MMWFQPSMCRKSPLLVPWSVVLATLIVSQSARAADDPPANAKGSAKQEAPNVWEPDPASVGKLGKTRSLFRNRATIRPPAGYSFEESSGLRTAEAVFVAGPNRLEIVVFDGRDAFITYKSNIATTRHFHSVMNGRRQELGEIELGSIGGVPFARFRYEGTDEDGQEIQGVYYVTRPHRSGPIWHVVAQGEAETFPLLEASAQTFRSANR